MKLNIIQDVIEQFVNHIFITKKLGAAAALGFQGKEDGLGAKGFGYDPLFLPNGFDRTFGQMSAEEKHGLSPKGQGLSHRARAFIKLAAACLHRA